MKLIYAIIAFMLIAPSAFAAERESYYSDLVCSQEYKGTTKWLQSGLRPDCQTTFAIMEFDWATQTKLYECIGQSLIYANEANKLPVCVLLARNDEELAFANSQDLTPFGIVLKVIDTRLWDQ